MNSGQGVFNEIAIMQEAQKVGVTDIPKLYMANPLGCIAQNPDINGTTTKGAWEIIELVDETRRVPQNGLKFLTFPHFRVFHSPAPLLKGCAVLWETRKEMWKSLTGFKKK